MDGVVLTEIIAAVLIVCVALPLAWLMLRRRWLARGGGAFECGLRLHTRDDPGTGWVLGAARYRGEELEWFRIFSVSLAPRVSMQRRQTRVVQTRDPDSVEAVLLYDGQRVVELDSAGTDWQLAMNDDAVTALLSWLEAAPPGAHR